MPNEIFVPIAVPADVMYVVEFNAGGQAWNGSAFVTFTSTRPTFVLHRATVGDNGIYGPYDSQSGTVRWVAFVTTQTAGNESATLDESAWEDGFVRAVDASGNAIATLAEQAKIPKSDGSVSFNSTAATALAAAIEQAIINDGDATAVLQAIADKIAGDLTVGDITAQAMATAVWQFEPAIPSGVYPNDSDQAGHILRWLLTFMYAVHGNVGPWGGDPATGNNSLLRAMQALYRSDGGVSVPAIINTGGGTADNANHSLQSIRDRGDAAWTGSGGGGGTVANFDNTKIVQTRVLKIGSRRDGVYTTHSKARYIQGELTPFWVDMSRFVGPDPVYDLEEPTASPTLAFSSYGVNRELLVIWPTTVGKDAGEYTVNIEVHPHPGETVIVEAIVVIADPIV